MVIECKILFANICTDSKSLNTLFRRKFEQHKLDPLIRDNTKQRLLLIKTSFPNY